MAGKDDKGKGERVLKLNQVTEVALVTALSIDKEDAWKEIKAPKALDKTLTADLYKKTGLEKDAERILKELKEREQIAPNSFEAQVLTKLQSDKAFDLNGDGTVSDREMAAILIAGSLDAQKKFDGNFSKQDRENLLSEKNKDAVIAIARELVNGSGVTTAAPAIPAAPTTRGIVVAQDTSPQR